ncbi:MAG TPA: hypothetical protein PKD28_00295 [Candidatus Saccharibacteria bacterium]|nr:hypothetical protein [Candidatus Saccharibacteria bacterium]
MNKKHILYITITTLTLGLATLLTPIAPTAAAADLECGVLPSSLCNAATKGDKDKIEDTGVWKLLKLVVNIMTAGAGILAIAGIIYGSVMYTTAGGNQEQVKKARGILTNVVIGVIAFAAMWALLQWLLPGGVLNK